MKPRELTADLVVDLLDGQMKFVRLVDAEGFLYQFGDQEFGGCRVRLIEKSAYDKALAALKLLAVPEKWKNMCCGCEPENMVLNEKGPLVDESFSYVAHQTLKELGEL